MRWGNSIFCSVKSTTGLKLGVPFRGLLVKRIIVFGGLCAGVSPCSGRLPNEIIVLLATFLRII